MEDTAKGIVPQVFSSDEFGSVRTVLLGGQPLFFGKDVAVPLGYTNPQKAIRDHVDEEDRTVNDSFTVNGTAPVLINESGVFSLILSSKLPKAREFKHWVTSEILPAIHRDGGYMASRDETPEQTMARAVLLARRTIERQESLIGSLRPRAALADAVTANGQDTYTVTQAARYVAQLVPSFTRQGAFELLRRSRMLCKGSCEPTREGIDVGRVVAVRSEFRTRDGQVLSRQHARLTGKGLSWLVSRALEGAV